MVSSWMIGKDYKPVAGGANSGDNYRAQGGGEKRELASFSSLPLFLSHRARCTPPISPECAGNVAGPRSISTPYWPSAGNIYFSILPRESGGTIKDIKNYSGDRMTFTEYPEIIRSINSVEF